jgi:hypothetical protein
MHEENLMNPARKISSRLNYTRGEETSQQTARNTAGRWAVPIVATLLAGLITLLVTQLQISHQDKVNEKSKLEVFYRDTTEHLEKINILFKKACLANGSVDDEKLIESLSNYRSRYQTFKSKLDKSIITALESYGELVAENLFAAGMTALDGSKKQESYQVTYISYLEARDALARLLPLLS